VLNWPIVLGIVAVLVALRLFRAGLLTWSLAAWLCCFVFLKFGFAVPVPSSVRTIYLTILAGAILAYVSSDAERWASFFGPIVRVATESRYRMFLVLIVLLLPTMAALNVYVKMNVPLEAPSFPRTVHPAPPDSIAIHETTLDLIAGDNPYRSLAHDDPEAFEQHLENGRRVYFENCFYCHGDNMNGRVGMFSYGLNPIPTNFTDQGILPMFQETFLVWRVSKGGPGIPAEGGPWDSAMPAWEKFLTAEEMWDAVMYLYEYTGYAPRAQEVHH
jgi:hypothetical protein